MPEQQGAARQVEQQGDHQEMVGGEVEEQGAVKGARRKEVVGRRREVEKDLAGGRKEKKSVSWGEVEVVNLEAPAGRETVVVDLEASAGREAVVEGEETSESEGDRAARLISEVCRMISGGGNNFFYEPCNCHPFFNNFKI